MKQRTDFFNTNLTYFVIIVLFTLVRIGTSVGAFDFMGEVGNYFLNVLIQVGFMFLLPLIMFKLLSKRTFKQTFKDFKFNKIDLKSVLLSIAIGVIVFVLNIAISSFFNFIIQLFGYSPSYSTGSGSGYPLWLFFVNLILTGVLPGFCEEVAHRGLLLNGFKELGAKKAIFLSALLFGLMHLNIEQFFYATIIGLLLGFLVLSTNSIIPAMIIHFMNNSISVYLDFAQVNKLPFGNLTELLTNALQGSNFIVAMLIIMLVLVALTFLLCWLVYLLIKQTTGKRVGNLVKDLKENLQQESSEGEVLQAQKISIKIPTEFLGINVVQTRKPAFVEKIFLYGTLILSVAVTISTFIWGTL